ncbi:MAG: hypothetical protein PHS71_08830 [Proteiniphilum sp.]|nr:hypothetical protein [Proteiniphilum sp.]MDD3968969.1 hypothetical protein [Proteiniphilum sp.]
MRTNILTIFILLFTTFPMMAEVADSTRYPSIELDGTLKNKYEYATETDNSRFSVRSSRIGIKGDINNFASYRAQLELSDNGDFKVLDLYGTLMPVEGLSFSLGQMGIPLFNSYITTPATMMFANRAFIGKYFLSTRDLGVMAKYKFQAGSLPVNLEGGLFNGNAINDPVWKNKLSYGARLELGSMEGVRVTAKMYNYPKDETKQFFIYGADFRYATGNWKLETEVMKRESKTELFSDLLSYYIQSAYNLPLKSRFFNRMIPALRWDAVDEDFDSNGFDVSRLTTGLGFGFNHSGYSSILRFDYEWYMVENEMAIFAENPEMDSNKFTVELLITF